MEVLPQCSQPPHVVFFTHNEHSHILPMFAMAQLLAGHGLRVTCALPRTSYASYRRNTASSSDESNSSDAPFDVVPVEELSEDAIKKFNHLQKKLGEGLIQLLQRLQPPPSFLIADLMYAPWAQGVADHVGATLFLFAPFVATAVLISCYLEELIEKGFLPFQRGTEDKLIDFIPGVMEGFRVRDMPLDFRRRTLQNLKDHNCLHWKDSAGLLLCNSSDVLPGEADVLDALCSWGLQTYTLGPILRMHPYNKSAILFREDEACLSWLNEQPPASVVYASFGGVISLTKEEVDEVAQGLEACGQPFLWVIRSVVGCSDVSSALPQGFLERVGSRACIVAWAPQTAVLSHPSVGCFLFHCGAASALDAIWTGVPMIGGFYRISDQNTVFRLLADGWRVAMPLTQSQPCEATNLKAATEAAIKEVLHGQGVGAAIRKQVVQLKTAMWDAAGPGGSSRRDFDQIVKILLSPRAGTPRCDLDQC